MMEIGNVNDNYVLYSDCSLYSVLVYGIVCVMCASVSFTK